MVIDRFGGDYLAAYPFPTYKAEDDWEITRPPVVQQVGGTGGVYDFFGSKNYPIGPLTVRKTFNVISGLVAGPELWRLKQVGTGYVFTAEDSGFPGIFDDIRPELRGFASSTLFNTEVAEGNQIRITFGGDDYIAVVDTITDDGSLTVTVAADLPAQIREGVDLVGFEIWESYHEYSRTYAGVETALNALKAATIVLDEAKLWGLQRDASKRWAWAKCIELKPPEKYSAKTEIPVSIAFHLAEGLWYAETQSTINRTANGTFSVTNNGDYPALVKVILINMGPTITAVTLTNTTNGYTWTYGNDIVSTKTLVVDAEGYSCQNNGVDDYDGLTIPATQIAWLQLQPGANSLTLTVTGSTPNWSANLLWYDTWL